MCAIIMAGEDPLTSLAEFNAKFNAFSGASCTQTSYKQYISQLSDTRSYPSNPYAASYVITSPTAVHNYWRRKKKILNPGIVLTQYY